MNKKTLIWMGVVVLVLIVGYLSWMSLRAPEVITEFSNDEHAELGDNRISASREALVGTWISKDDAKFRRDFFEDGTVWDGYEGGDAPAKEGIWNVFTKESPDNEFTGTYEDGAVYLKIVMKGDKLFYKLARVTPEELELIFLDRGNTLRFERFQPMK